MAGEGSRRHRLPQPLCAAQVGYAFEGDRLRRFHFRDLSGRPVVVLSRWPGTRISQARLHGERSPGTHHYRRLW